MAKKYTYYPGCRSQSSSSHLDISLRAIAPKLDVELEDLNDWNCCGAAVAHVEAGTLAVRTRSEPSVSKVESEREKPDRALDCPHVFARLGDGVVKNLFLYNDGLVLEHDVLQPVKTKQQNCFVIFF